MVHLLGKEAIKAEQGQYVGVDDMPTRDDASDGMHQHMSQSQVAVGDWQSQPNSPAAQTIVSTSTSATSSDRGSLVAAHVQLASQDDTFHKCLVQAASLSPHHGVEQPSGTVEGACGRGPTKQHRGSDSSAGSASLGTSLFFARVPPTVEVEDIRSLFERFGKVLDLNLFRPWATAKTSKGCGIVVYETIADCVAAMNSLHNRHHWTGGETTMVVEWADPSRQRKENPNAKGVFEAKHKSQSTCGSCSRYRSQMMKRVFAPGLQGGGCPPEIPSILNTLPGINGNSTNTPLPMASRGVLAMAPQLAASTSWDAGRMRTCNMQHAHASMPFTPTAPRAEFGANMFAAAALAGAAGYAASAASPADVATTDMSTLLPELLLSQARAELHAVPTAGVAVSQHGYRYAQSPSWEIPSPEGAASPCPGSPSTAYMGTPSMTPPAAARLRPVLTTPLLRWQQQQQSAHVLSRLGPAGTARLMGEGCSSACGTPSCMQQHCSFDALVQQQLQLQQPQPLSYCSASAGLVADASMVAAAATSMVPQHVLAGEDCHTPLSFNSDLTMGATATPPLGASSSSLTYVPSATAGAFQASLQQQQHWPMLQEHYHSRLSCDNSSSASLPHLVCGPPAVAELGRSFCNSHEVAFFPTPAAQWAALTGTPSYLQQQLLGAAQASLDAAPMCHSGPCNPGQPAMCGWV